MAQDTELLKLVITAASAIIGGMALEPIKIWIGEHLKKRKLRRICCEDLLYIRSIALSVSNAFARAEASGTDPDTIASALPNLNLTRLKYAVERETSISFQLDEYATILQILEALKNIQPETPGVEMKRVSDLVVAVIDNAADRGWIDAQYLTRVHLDIRWADRKLFRRKLRWQREIDNGYRAQERPLILRPVMAKFVYTLERWRAWFIDHRENAERESTERTHSRLNHSEPTP